MNHKIRLTPEIEQSILSFIRVGGYAHIAAQAAGVPDLLWKQWEEWSKKRNPYKAFFAKVDQAKAQARLKAEIAAMEEDPRFWLKNGPGKEGPDNPGWAAMVRPMLTQNNQTINLFSSPDFLQFMATLRAVLAPYPEALMALSKALDQPIEVDVKCSPQGVGGGDRPNQELPG